MSIESSQDWSGLRRVARVVRLTLDALEAAVKPGVTTADLDAVAAREFARHGARSAPRLVYGIPASALISIESSRHRL